MRPYEGSFWPPSKKTSHIRLSDYIVPLSQVNSSFISNERHIEPRDVKSLFNKAMINEDYENLCILLASSEDIKAIGLDEVHSHIAKAIEKNKLPFIQKLLEIGFDFNFRILWFTPLQWAIHWQQEEVIELFLSNKIDADFTHSDNLHPLVLACKIGNIQIIRRLLESVTHYNPVSGTDDLLFYLSGKVFFDYKESKKLIISKLGNSCISRCTEIKEWYLVKKIAHIFEVSGSSLVGNKICPWEANFSMNSFVVLSNLTRLFELEFPDNYNIKMLSIFSNCIEFLRCQLYYKKANCFLERIRENHPTIIEGGFSGHCVMFLFWCEYFVLANLGTETSGNIVIGKYQTLTIDDIDYLLKMNSREDYKNNFNNGLDSVFLKKIGFTSLQNQALVENCVGLPLQKVGNCTYANCKAIFYIFTFLSESFNLSSKPIKAIQESFLNFTLYEKVRIIEKYLIKCSTSHYPQKYPYPVINHKTNGILIAAHEVLAEVKPLPNYNPALFQRLLRVSELLKAHLASEGPRPHDVFSRYYFLY